MDRTNFSVLISNVNCGFSNVTTTVAFKYNSMAHRKMKYSLIPPPPPSELNLYIINGIRIATTQSHKSLAKLPLAIVNPN